jgi:putative molybdenum carrier protein
VEKSPQIIWKVTGLRDSCLRYQGRKAEDGRIDDRYNLVELSTTSYPARTRRNIEESDGTVIFSLERLLSGGTKLTWGLAKKLGKPVLHIYDAPKERISNPDSLCLEGQALTDFLRSNKIEVLNVADDSPAQKELYPGEPKRPAMNLCQISPKEFGQIIPKVST